MMAENLFNRYIWLVDTIYRAKKISFEDINERWKCTEMSDGEDLPLRTFHNHRKAIEEMFDINIECNKRGGYLYYIENAEEMEKGGIRSWLLNTFAVNNLINESHYLKQRILFEDIPSGREYLTPIIEAMRDSKNITITYQSFDDNKEHTFSLSPYCVKIFKQRWYVIAYNDYFDTIRIYALDRIHNIRIMDEKFDYPSDFDPQAFFGQSFGIIVDEECKPETVRIKAFGNKCKYLRALPLHHSQKEIETSDNYAVFEYLIRPTYDFYQELLMHACDIEVLSPKAVRDNMKSFIEEMSRQYK